MQTLGIVAGEASGDYLGAALVESLRQRNMDLEVEGVAGPLLLKAGCRSLYSMEDLAVMGLVEVLGSYPRLHAMRRDLVRHFLERRPDLFIGVDSPDFNLNLELALHRAGIRTVHYVSPSVWAWRRYRVRKIARAVDLVLTLFPFEEAFYREHGVSAKCVGHPLAHRIPLVPDRAAARRRLGIDEEGTLIALMPGSRRSEHQRLMEPFLRTAQWCSRRRTGLRFISSLLGAADVERLDRIREHSGTAGLDLTVWQDRSHDVLEAADVALVASGTVTLEAMLLKRPMVVGYRLNPVTWQILRRLVHLSYVSLPNLLARKRLVPECLQHECRPERLGAELLDWLDRPQQVAAVIDEFARLHRDLRAGGENAASNAISELMGWA